MDELKLKLDRYDGRHAADQIKADSLRHKGNKAWLVCEFGDDEEFEIHFEADGGVVEDSAIEVAKCLMRSIGELDNKVQESCAAECNRTGLHPKNFEGMLAYVRIFPNRAILHYFGTGVNTEWDEIASFDGYNWKYVGVSSPNSFA
jgi:hypothetical protein